MQSTLDEAIRKRGKAFFASIRGESPSIFNKGFWTGKVMVMAGQREYQDAQRQARQAEEAKKPLSPAIDPARAMSDTTTARSGNSASRARPMRGPSATVTA